MNSVIVNSSKADYDTLRHNQLPPVLRDAVTEKDMNALLDEYLSKLPSLRKQRIIQIIRAFVGAQPQATEVHVTYEYIGLSERGNDFVSALSAAVYTKFIAEWESLLIKYFASERYQCIQTVRHAHSDVSTPHLNAHVCSIFAQTAPGAAKLSVTPL